MRSPRTTNEWEFQGEVLGWIQEELDRRPGLRLDKVTQEAPNDQAKRSDLVVWRSRATRQAFLAVEIKTPTTAITDPGLLEDACKKAWKWDSEYFAIWNMQSAELYRTPSQGHIPDPSLCIYRWPLERTIRDVECWLDSRLQLLLKKRAVDILDKAWGSYAQPAAAVMPIEASVFVERLVGHQQVLRTRLSEQIQGISDRQVRTKLRSHAAQQGFLGFVTDYENAIAGQYAYRLIGQILFYFALRRRQPSLEEIVIDPGTDVSGALRGHWNAVRRFDYEALFAPSEFESLIPLSREIETELRRLVDGLKTYDWAAVGDDVLGSVFERLIPREEQLILGQFYTPPAVADILIACCASPSMASMLDPGCGSGTFLLRAYDYLRSVGKLSHHECLSRLWGFDISPFATELSVINLFRQNLSSFDNYPRVLSGSFFDRQPGHTVEFPPSRSTSTGKIRVSIPRFDAILGNPPYLRSQNQDDLDQAYKASLIQLADSMHVTPSAKFDLFAYFVLQADHFSKPGTRLGFVTSASWLNASYGAALQRFLLARYRIVAVMSSAVEPFFSHADINTILLVAERRHNVSGPVDGETVTFVRFKRMLRDIFSSSPTDWDDLRAFAETVEQNLPKDTADYEIRQVSAQEEYAALEESPAECRNWSRHLRSGNIYEQLIAETSDKMCVLSDLADVSLGFKSLQNNFFYLSPQASAGVGIEAEYIRSVYLVRDLDAGSYLQDNAKPTGLFHCDRPEHDIRGTGAFRYIRRMANLPAREKKQSQSAQAKTIKEVLEKQGGKYWYAPKSGYHKAHIWLRKAFDGVYSPFIFMKEAVVDQRCNRIVPRSKVEWEELAALLTSSVFALILEAEGKAAMGAGALEWTTKQLRNARVLDIRHLTKEERRQLIVLARRVWKGEPTTNVNAGKPPGRQLRSLDTYVLSALGSSLSVDDAYEEISRAVSERRQKATSRKKLGKQSEAADIGEVVSNIVQQLEPLLASRQFPESYLVPTDQRQAVSIPHGEDVTVHADQLLSEAHVAIVARDARPLWEASLGHRQAEVIVRALQCGRREFTYPDSEQRASEILAEFRKTLGQILSRLSVLVSSSTVGTRYEEEVKRGCLRALGISPSIEDAEFWGMHLIDTSSTA